MRLSLLSFVSSALLASAASLSSSSLPVSFNDISGTLYNGPSTAQLTAQKWGLDAPKVSNMNSSSFDWWYYDVVSSNLDYSVVLVFWHAAPSGLWDNVAGGIQPPTTVWTSLVVTLPDGSVVQSGTVAEELVVLNTGNSSSGTLSGTGWGWASLPDLSLYEIVIDDPTNAVQGTVTLQSTSPAHYPCGLASATKPGDSIAFGEYFGWANAVPDANAVVDLTINGTKVAFSGSGYHDKNWAPVPTQEAIKTWYWGHGRLGPYNVVWFDVILNDGTEQSSNYVVQNGKVLASSCSGLTVRPTGTNATFPPVHGANAPAGFTMSMAIDGGKKLEIEVTHKTPIAAEEGTFYRWIGELSGGVTGGTKYNGTALYEQFAF